MGLKSWGVNKLASIKHIILTKSFKLSMLIIVLIFFTTICLRKVDGKKEKIDSYVRDRLSSSKNYVPVSVDTLRLDSPQMVTLKKIISENKIKIEFKNILAIEDRFRLNDTLYSVNLLLNKQGKIIAMDKIRKVVD